MTEKKRAQGQRLNYCGYASVVRAVQQLGRLATGARVADAINSRPTCTRSILRRMAALGVLRIQAWEKTRGPYAAVYEVADGRPDAEYPADSKRIPSKANESNHIRPELIGFCLAFLMLKGGALQHQIIKEVGISRGTVRKLIAHSKQIGLIHVSAWNRPLCGDHLPIYKVGSAQDAEKPPRKTASECWREQYRRKVQRRNADPFAVPADFESPVRQSVVKATSRRLPATTAANSVFAMGRGAA